MKKHHVFLVFIFLASTCLIHAKPKKKLIALPVVKLDTVVTDLKVVSVDSVISQSQTETIPTVIYVDTFSENVSDSLITKGDLKMEQFLEKIDKLYAIAVENTPQKILIHIQQFDSLSSFFYVFFSDKSGKVLINKKLHAQQAQMEINHVNLKQADYVLNIIDADFKLSNIYYFKRKKN